MIFEYKHVVDYLWVKCATTKHTCHALAWLDDLNAKNGYRRNCTWEAMKNEMVHEFLQEDFQQ